MSADDAQSIIEGSDDRLVAELGRSLMRLVVPPGDTWFNQAQRLWRLGYGHAQGIESFGDYLKTVPRIPHGLIAYNPYLPFLTLDDPRVPLARRAELVGVKFKELGYTDETVVPYDSRHNTPDQPYWFRADDGHRNRERKPAECRTGLTGNLLAGTVDTGFALIAQHRGVLEGGTCILDLPGSVMRGVTNYCFSLRILPGGEAQLQGRRDDCAFPGYGGVICQMQ